MSVRKAIALIQHDVFLLPCAPDAWDDVASVKTGYEISFTRYSYKPHPLRTLEEIRADILAVERETEGLLVKIVGASSVLYSDDTTDPSFVLYL